MTWARIYNCTRTRSLLRALRGAERANGNRDDYLTAPRVQSTPAGCACIPIGDVAISVSLASRPMAAHNHGMSALRLKGVTDQWR